MKLTIKIGQEEIEKGIENIKQSGSKICRVCPAALALEKACIENNISFEYVHCAPWMIEIQISNLKSWYAIVNSETRKLSSWIGAFDNAHQNKKLQMRHEEFTLDFHMIDYKLKSLYY